VPLRCHNRTHRVQPLEAWGAEAREPLMTSAYTHPNDQEMWESLRGLNC
jgi:hypothetical protein